ncbi:MAG: RcpC/CpaB family pilus assembly protein [Lachnospiraceae bacterium]|nr:RcpC/CpaB family pilus assembly protein [Lachnospiraceae bacterium]
MNILKNRTILGLISIVLSLIICFGLTPMFNNAVKSQVEIIRMVKDVKQGEVITADMVTKIKVGGYNLPTDVLKEMDSVIGKYAKYDMQSGDYILYSKLSNTALTEFLYLHELDGAREAMSITIKSFAAGLSGKLEAGDIVSIIASDVGDFRETIAPPELKYVKVLAVTDGRGYDKAYTDDSKSDEERELPSTVTLLVVPTQAVALAELENTGRIHLTLVYRGTEENRNAFLAVQDKYLFSLESESKNDDETYFTEERGNIGGQEVVTDGE